MQLSQAAYLALASATGLAACADPKPVSVDQAMAQCTERARAALKPEIAVGVGIGTGGHYGTRVHGGIGIELSPDYLKGTPPEEVYETCVVAKSGVKPTEPLQL